MKAVVFDFGGTLDTNGVHWSEKFFEAYLKIGIPITREEFNKAYCAAEPGVDKFISADSSFEEVLQKQVLLQVECLSVYNKLFHFLKKNILVQQIASLCYADVKSEISKSRQLLASLKNNYKMGIISNFYGNLENVLKEFEINLFFDAAVDSKITGYRKPDERLFKEIINKLNEKAENVVMIGDSYSRDIVPAKYLGCRTIWLNVKSWEKPEDISAADIVIDDLAKIKEAIPSFCDR